MDRKFSSQWINHHLDPKNNKCPHIPEGVSIAKIRRDLIDQLCDHLKINVNETDPALSLHDAARKMNAEVPEGDIDRQTALLYRLAIADDSNGGSSPDLPS